MGLYPCDQIDHDNGDKLDLRRDNLLASDSSHNQRNIHKERLIGVYKLRHGKRWIAVISMGKRGEKQTFISLSHPTKERAAFAYNQLAQLFGFRTRNNVQIPKD